MTLPARIAGRFYVLLLKSGVARLPETGFLPQTTGSIEAAVPTFGACRYRSHLMSTPFKVRARDRPDGAPPPVQPPGFMSI